MKLLDFIRGGLAVEPPAHGGKIDADLLSKLYLRDPVFKAVKFQLLNDVYLHDLHFMADKRAGQVKNHFSKFRRNRTPLTPPQSGNACSSKSAFSCGSFCLLLYSQPALRCNTKIPLR